MGRGKAVFSGQRGRDAVIWFSHKKYTAEFYAAGLAEICLLARRNTRCMTLVAGGAVLFMTAANVGFIYGL